MSVMIANVSKIYLLMYYFSCSPAVSHLKNDFFLSFFIEVSPLQSRF